MLRVLAVTAALLCIPALAFAEGGVRYSYEKVNLGSTPEWVLVPRAVDGLQSGSANDLRKAFEALRKDKRATYGKSGIAVSGNPPKAKVKVTIDSAVAQYALIIIAETVYTMSELGVDGVEFPGYASGTVTRDEVPFAAYALTVPLWKAVGRFSSPTVQVLMPDGSLEPSPEISKRWKSKDSKLRGALYDYLKASDVYTVTTVAKLLPSLDLPYASEVSALLTHDNATVRSAALETLEGVRNEEKVLDAVVAMMNAEKDDTLARAAAEFLDKAKSDKYSVQREYFLLDRGKQAERLLAAKELGSSKDSRTKDKLYDTLTDKDDGVARAAAESLAKLDADDEQKKALKNDKIAPPLRLDIARDLAEDKEKGSRVPGLVYVAEHGPDYEATAAVAQLGKLDARSEVEEFLGSRKQYLRLAAAKALVSISSPSSLDAIAKAVKAGSDADTIEDAGYRIMLAQPLKTILDKTKDRDALIQRMAYRAAGERAQKEGAGAKAFKVLEDGVGSRDPLVRGAAARAIGTYKNDDAAKILAKLVSDKSATVRRDVAFAIGYLPEGKMADELKKYLDDSDSGVQAAAIDSLAKRGEAFAWDRIKALSADKSPEVRASALAAMARLVSRDDAQGVREVISKLSGGVTDKDLTVRESAVRSLGTFKDDSAVTSIALALGAEEESLRIASIEALANTGNRNATDLIGNALNDPSRNVRAAAIDALAQLKDASAKRALEERAKIEKDEELVAEIKKTIKKL